MPWQAGAARCTVWLSCTRPVRFHPDRCARVVPRPPVCIPLAPAACACCAQVWLLKRQPPLVQSCASRRRTYRSFYAVHCLCWCQRASAPPLVQDIGGDVPQPGRHYWLLDRRGQGSARRHPRLTTNAVLLGESSAAQQGQRELDTRQRCTGMAAPASPRQRTWFAETPSIGCPSGRQADRLTSRATACAGPGVACQSRARERWRCCLTHHAAFPTRQATLDAPLLSPVWRQPTSKEALHLLAPPPPPPPPSPPLFPAGPQDFRAL